MEHSPNIEDSTKTEDSPIKIENEKHIQNIVIV